MDGCIYRTKDGECDLYAEGGKYLSFCGFYKSNMELCEGRKLSNADRIRSMTDEELAKWYFVKFFPCVPYCSMLQDGCPEHDDCKICLLEWLRQEAGK